MKSRKAKIIVSLIVVALICVGIGTYCIYAHDRDEYLDSVTNHYFSPKSRDTVKDLVISEEQTIDADGYHFVLREYIYESTIDTGYFLIEVTKKGTNMKKLFEDYKGEMVKGLLDSNSTIVPEYVLELQGERAIGMVELDKEATRNKLYIYGRFESNPIMKEDTVKIGIRRKYYNENGVLIDESASPEGEFELKGTECSKMYTYGKNNIVVTPFMLLYHQTKYNVDMLPGFEIYYKDGTKSEMYYSRSDEEYGDNISNVRAAQSTFELNGEYYENAKYDCYYFTNPINIDEIDRIETCGEVTEPVKK